MRDLEVFDEHRDACNILEEHNRLLAKFDESSREYAFLKNGFVVRSAAGCEEIQIPTDKAGAELIMVLVGSACPDILPAIRLLGDAQ